MLKCETGYPFPSSTEVNKAWTFTSGPVVCFHGMMLKHSDDYTCYQYSYEGNYV